MEFLADLWLPIVLAAVLVFLASSCLHMLLPLHKGDFQKLPGEADVLAAMRAQGVAAGAYMFPRPASMKDMASVEMQEKYRLGPVGTMIVLPSGVPAIGKSLVQWFCFSLLVGVLVAYLAWHALRAGDPYLEVFRISGTAALLGYCFTNVLDSVWKGQRWSVSLRFALDGIVYALLTAGAFAGFWPAA